MARSTIYNLNDVLQQFEIDSASGVITGRLTGTVHWPVPRCIYLDGYANAMRPARLAWILYHRSLPRGPVALIDGDPQNLLQSNLVAGKEYHAMLRQRRRAKSEVLDRAAAQIVAAQPPREFDRLVDARYSVLEARLARLEQRLSDLSSCPNCTH